MTIHLPAPLVAAIQSEYPGCAPDPDSMADLIEATMWAHLKRNRDTRRAIEESRLVEGLGAEREDSTAVNLR